MRPSRHGAVVLLVGCSVVVLTALGSCTVAVHRTHKSFLVSYNPLADYYGRRPRRPRRAEVCVSMPQSKMIILTQCAACAAPLGQTSGKKCGRCSTRYCGPACQKKHWEEGGHNKLCKKIKKAGGAEQYHADKKYKEAVAVAVEKCAAATKGQTCFICTQAIHWKTKEGLVNGYCACRGTMGIAHVSCLAQQAQSAMDDEFSKEDFNARGSRWHTCRLCGQKIHSEVRCALGWANWRTCVKAAAAGELPPAELATRQLFAVQQLGNGMQDLKGNEEEALKMHEIYLDTLKRDFSHYPREMLFIALGNLATSYCGLGRHEECLALEMESYQGWKDLYGPSHERTILGAMCASSSLNTLKRYAEAREFMREQIDISRRSLGASHEMTLKLRRNLCKNYFLDQSNFSAEEMRQALSDLEDVLRLWRRVFGEQHPQTKFTEAMLLIAQMQLASGDASTMESFWARHT